MKHIVLVRDIFYQSSNMFRIWANARWSLSNGNLLRNDLPLFLFNKFLCKHSDVQTINNNNNTFQ